MNRWMLNLLVGVMVWGGVASPLCAQGNFDPQKSVRIEVKNGALELESAPNSHLKTAFMKMEQKEGQGLIKLGALPAATDKDELGDGIWRGLVRVPLISQNAQGPVVFEVTYQPCTEGEGGVCYAPQKKVIRVDASTLKGDAKTPLSRGLLFVFLSVFGAGLLASLTPCVYPMIPITMVIIGAKGGGKAKGFLLSLTLVLGMAVTYTLLGVIAAKSGAAFGASVQKPFFLIPVSLLFAAFALSLFGAFEISLPASLQTKLQGNGPRTGFGGAFVMGLVLGPISAPCVGPVIGTILLGIAQQGQVWLGATQLFVFALGMGVLFMIVGTFSAALPRSGNWLTTLKQVMGLIVLGFAVWNVRYIVPLWLNQALWGLVLLVGAAVLGAFSKADDVLSSLRRAVALLSLLLGLLLGLRAVESGLNLELLPRGGAAEKKEETWKQVWMERDFEGARTRAKAEKKVVLVDIYAEWCAQCHELDEKTWPDAGVSSWIKANAIAVRLDTDKDRKDLATQLKIVGYPTVLVLDAEGRELRRETGFQKPEAMLAFLNR
jgi:thioredoxin:protein disulfide reductase